jgi:hypothetical protein
MLRLVPARKCGGFAQGEVTNGGKPLITGAMDGIVPIAMMGIDGNGGKSIWELILILVPKRRNGYCL